MFFQLWPAKRPQTYNTLNSEVIDGVRVELIAQNGEKGFAEFGVTVKEAY